MKLVITIDTEEDNWRPFCSDIRTRNAREIARLHDLFLDEEARPTYLITWPMAQDDVLVDTLAEENRAGRCEVGSHCHPWTTPPHGEPPLLSNSMLCNLPAEQVAAKLEQLHTLITQRFGIAPRSFRAGRWGYGIHVAAALHRLGYQVDTSITAFTDWSSEFGPDYSQMGPAPYRFDPPHIYAPSAAGALLELPATVGFLHRDFPRRARLERTLRKRPMRWMRMRGLLDRLGLHKRVVLSPECANATDMIRLIDTMQAQGYPCVNLFFHSPTLLPGLTPFVTTRRDRDAFMQSLRRVLRHARNRGLQPILAGSFEEAGRSLQDPLPDLQSRSPTHALATGMKRSERILPK